jgi:hypothetical protein
MSLKRWSATFIAVVTFSFVSFSFVAIGQATAQESRFTKLRGWSDASGKFKRQAKMLSATTAEVVLETDAGDNLSIPLKVLSTADQEFVQSYLDKSFDDLKQRSRETIFASELLKAFSEYESSGHMTESQQSFVESRIAELNDHADEIVFLDGYLPVADLPEKKKQTKAMVDAWINGTSTNRLEKRQTMLRDAIKADPTSMEAAIILALFHEIKSNDARAAQRCLDSAIKRSSPYLKVGTETDKANLLVAMNNLAVSYVTSQNIAKAKRVWGEAFELSSGQLPQPSIQNISKTNRMMGDINSGLKANSSLQKSFVEFSEQVGAVQFSSDDSKAAKKRRKTSAGWQMMCPLDCEGNVRSDLEILLANTTLQELSGTVFYDRTCLQCRGAAFLRCPNKSCREGKVKKQIVGKKTMKTTDGGIHDMGVGVIRVDIIVCPVCKGEDKVDCHCCEDGAQD